MNKEPIIIKLSEYQENASISNFSILGHVAHGKTSLNKMLTNIDTKRFGIEKINGCTVKMGYANLKIYSNGTNYLLNPSSEEISDEYKLIRHFSISDNPGHNSYMATMITGSSTIDNCLFLIAGDKGIEKQTYQHMKCLKLTGITDFAIIISKVDLVSTVQHLEDLIHKIDDFMDEQNLDPDIYDPKYIPVSSFTKVNLDALIKYLVSSPYPKNIMNLTDKPLQIPIIRSFDINKPGTSILDLNGAVFGGAILQGYLLKDDFIMVLPGHIEHDLKDGTYKYTPLISKVNNIKASASDLSIALPGGFIGISTTLDPSFSKNNNMVGHLIVKINSIEDIHNISNVTNIIYLSNITNFSECDLKEDDDYMLIIHGSEQIGKLVSINDNIYKFVLRNIVATIIGEKVVIMKKTDTMNDIVSYGIIDSIKITDNIIMKLPEDVNEYLSDIMNTKSRSIKVINDIEPVMNTEQINNDLDISNLLSNISFVKKKYVLKYDTILLDTNTTSVIITNAKKIISNFTNDSKVSMKLLHDLGDYIKLSMNTLKTSIVNIDGNKISFDGLRNTRKFIGPQFNTLLHSFVESKFTCNNCNTNGSLYIESKKTLCRACNAITRG